MEQKTSDEDSRIKAAVDEKDSQKAAEDAEKAAKREQMLRSIKEHRQDQVVFSYFQIPSYSLALI
jgi:hypothetical protein